MENSICVDDGGLNDRSQLSNIERHNASQLMMDDEKGPEANDRNNRSINSLEEQL